MATDNTDLTDIIEDSVTDALTDVDEPVQEAGGQVVEEEGSVPAVLVSAEPVIKEKATVTEVAVPVVEAKGEDEFSKRFGIPAESVTGRENRIPYSRVKKIVERNERDTVARITKELEATYQPKSQEYEAKVTDYEGRLSKVAEFEQIMENEPKAFLEMLSRLPAYKEFFAYINQLTPSAAQASLPTTKVEPSDAMPQPNKVNPDGSRVYDLDGLNALMEWQGKQVEKRVSSQLEERVSKRYAPLEQEWQHRQYLERVTPVIDQQIADARTWDRFKELEPKVIELLKSDGNMTLERAYMKAYQGNVVPRLTAERNKIRSEVIEELKRQPATTAAPVTTTQPRQGAQGNRSLDDIIAEEMAKLRG